MEAEQPSAEEVPEWMREETGTAPQAIGEPQTTAQEVPEWLREAGATAQPSAPEEEEIPEWLRETRSSFEPVEEQPAAQAEIGQIKNIGGQAFLIRNNVQQPAKAGDLLEQADVLTTGPYSNVGITFIDNSRFSAGPNSRLELKQFRFNSTTQEGEFVTDIQRGTLAIVSGQIAKQSPEAMKVKTSSIWPTARTSAGCECAW